MSLVDDIIRDKALFTNILAVTKFNFYVTILLWLFFTARHVTFTMNDKYNPLCLAYINAGGRDFNFVDMEVSKVDKL